MASQEHKDLANTIKGTHVKLRKAARERGSDEAWTMHVKNKDELKEYASAMHKLATEHWDKNDKNVSRIQWVVDVCQEYFKNGGYLSAQRKEENLQRVYFSKELEASAVDDRDLGEVHFDKTFKGSEEKIGDLFGVNPNKVSKANEEKIGDLYGVDFNKELENSVVIDGVSHGIDSRLKLEPNERNFEGLNRIDYEKELEVNDDGLNRIGSNKKIETSEEKHREIHIVDSNKKLDASEETYRDSLIVNSKNRVEGNETKYRDLFHVVKDTNKKLEASEEKYRDFHEVDYNIDRISNEVNFGLDGEIRLLDVGSCYNPFKNFDLFDKVTAIDLAPATEDVLQCDFLNLNIVSGDSSFLIPASSTCTELPGDYFDVVVFSLLLEYLPCRKQRWSCCLNAYKLLKPGGLLVIIPPDSKHASANSKLIKSWRLALASLGFMLVKCEKQQHVNCLAYRKCFNRKVAEYWLTLQKPEGLVPEDMICIPQDFNDYKEDECDVERVVLDREAIVGDFSELPSFED